MRYNRACVTIVTLLLIAAASCSKSFKPIPAKTLSEIMEKMFLADQIYVMERDRVERLDSTNMYASIIEDYGYTIEDYRQSVTYYLQQPRGITDIVKRTADKLRREADALKAIVDAKNAKEAEMWSGIDSITSIPTDSLISYPKIRALKWILNPLEIIGEPLMELSNSDIPSNILWWRNNFNAVKSKIKVPFMADYDTGEKENANDEEKENNKVDENVIENVNDEIDDDGFPSDEALDSAMTVQRTKFRKITKIKR